MWIRIYYNLVKKIKNVDSNINVILGDVKNPPFKDKSVGAYIFLEIIENYFDDHNEILSHSYRILQENGLIPIKRFSPHSCISKKAMKRFEPFLDKKSDLKNLFYQLYFTKEAIEEILIKNGLTLYKVFYYAPLYGAKIARQRFLSP